LQKTSKIAVAVFLFLIILAVPLYFLSRPDTAQPDIALQVKGKVGNPLNLTLSQLEALPSVTIEVTLSSSSKPADNGVFNYTGIPIQLLLDQAGVSNATSFFVQASDGYGTTLSLQEASNQNTIIAYQKNGSALTLLKDDGEGPLRLIIGGDQYAQRWIRGVVEIEAN
jgi:DMSO/TMAO reductase YedYZ molybdopterin-dependent catalytic subunit